MKYVGIDLGTTNSAICSYDGVDLHLYKSPEQYDVTPSAIWIDRRGNKYVGSRAYINAARNPDNAAILFKRFMGTSTPINLTAVNKTYTPEECSAEILRVLYSYLPEEIRNNESTGTVITVPAAFNQMQKDATLVAANSAGIGSVALMQEPVAAVMSVMRQRKNDGVFVVYDLGGGTLDIAIAESISGRVSLLSHGGIAMCGGRDIDRTLYNSVVKSWLLDNFNLPEDLSINPQFKSLERMATWAAEKAKIELSQREQTNISLPETELGVRDLDGQEIYIDISINRQKLDSLIALTVDETIAAARETLTKAGLSANDVERVVFVGGPTHYKPLRDKVSFELGIAPSTDVNPMTAVAEGAAIFAESIDWNTSNRTRKSGRGTVSAGGNLNVEFAYIARTPNTKARVAAKTIGQIATGVEFQIDSLDTGWSSGRLPLKDGAIIDLALNKPGDNIFKIFVFDAQGGPINLHQDKIIISRTAASIDAIPASHSIGLEVRQKLGGVRVLDFLVKEGDPLPKKGKKIYKSEETLRSGTANSIKFKLWEGGIIDPITDNRWIGMFQIKGDQFEGVIPAGTELICEYEISDSGAIKLAVSVPSISCQFDSSTNYYSWVEAAVDYSKSSELVADISNDIGERLDKIEERISDSRLDDIRGKLQNATESLKVTKDPEVAKHSLDDIQQCKKILSQIRKTHLKPIRQIDLDTVVNFFESIKEYAKPEEITSYQNLVRTAQKSIDNNTSEFESYLDDLKDRNYNILWRQDWFIVERFQWLSKNSFLFPNQEEHQELVRLGSIALESNNIDKLRDVLNELTKIQFSSSSEHEMLARSNIVGI